MTESKRNEYAAALKDIARREEEDVGTHKGSAEEL